MARTVKFETLLARYASVEAKIDALNREASLIQSTCAAGQAPAVYYRLGYRALKLHDEKKLPLWKRMRSRIVQRTGKTLWQTFAASLGPDETPRHAEIAVAMQAQQEVE